MKTISLHQPIEEQELLLLLQAEHSRERGFRLLVSTYGDRLYHHVRQMTGVHEDAHDILQNTLVKAYRGIDRFAGKSKLYTWLYRIATNEALTFLEKRGRQQRLFTSAESLPQMPAAGKTDAPDGEYIKQRLQAAIATLPPKQRAVFSLRYFEEKSYREMADLLETSEGALKASYHHAVKKIEAFIKQ